MKVVLGQKKRDGKYVYGMDISKDGVVVYSATLTDTIDVNKYGNYVKLMTWASQKIKHMTMVGGLGETERVSVFINNKTLYNWLDKEVAPAPYTLSFTDLLLDLEFIVNEVEFIYSPSMHKTVKYINSVEKNHKATKASDMLKEFSLN